MLTIYSTEFINYTGENYFSPKTMANRRTPNTAADTSASLTSFLLAKKMAAANTQAMGVIIRIKTPKLIKIRGQACLNTRLNRGAMPAPGINPLSLVITRAITPTKIKLAAE